MNLKHCRIEILRRSRWAFYWRLGMIEAADKFFKPEAYFEPATDR
jgi:hypothetical protein